MTLTGRLSGFFLGALALVLVGFSVALYLLARAYLDRQVGDRLGGALDTLGAAVEVGPHGLEWEPAERHLSLGQEAGPEGVRWTVVDDRGQLVSRSANLDADRPLDGGPPGPSAEEGAWRVEWAGQPWQLARRRLRAAVPPGPPGPGKYGALVLTAGVSLAPAQGTLRALALTLAGLSSALWLAAAVAGRWVCRRALAPLTRMAAAARAMDATDLGGRLPDPRTRDELDDLRRAFNDLLRRLEEAFERQRRFTGDASHQLRTPLTAMLGQVEVSLRRDRSGQEYRQVLSLVQGQATHMRRIVEALLFLARADAEAGLEALEVLDLAVFVAALPGRLAGHARAADLRVECAGGPLWVRAQPVLVGQLLDNLLDNAIKYSDPGTAVTVGAWAEPGAVALAVRDAGRGIAPEDLAHVFEPFYRSPESRREGCPGVGLGLAVARRIARALGGDVGVVSTRGHGARFTLRLPAVAPEGEGA